ncbi:MAG TPA: glycosyltransferase family 9 protein [Candidatus Saccharimonadales bacterium]|nr:glycosyltransferase family 9 protein [Candidatus Saccharimonadales bacterium]
MDKAQDWAQLTNLLVVRLDNMGDVLMTTPAIRALKESLPERKITLLTSSVGAAVAKHIPEIDDVITFDVPWVKNSLDHSNMQTQALISALAERAFDGAIICTVYSQTPFPSAMLCYLAGIPRVLGYSHENPYGLITDWVPDTEPATPVRHEVQRQLDLVAQAGATTGNARLSLDLPEETHTATAEKLTAMGVNLEQPWLVLHPGASEPKRLYDPEGFIQAGRQLMEQGWQIVLTGSPSEAEQVAAIHHGLGDRAIDATGQLSLDELISAIGQAHVLVSNNTGPVHIAAATETPVVVLYAQTNPQHTPWQVPSEVLYFPVPQALKSQNYFLQDHGCPAEPTASPQAIIDAVTTLSAPVFRVKETPYYAQS